MTLIDFHTHHASLQGETVLQQGVHTWGIHPWKATAGDEVATLPPGKWMAIGECGLDRLCATPWDIQMQVFRRQILLNEEKHLPLILHCVKAQDELLALRRELRPEMPWILHGFRGKPVQMHQLLRHGLYISFGLLFHEESVRECPLDRLLIETDDRLIPVREVYEHIASLRGMSVNELAARMQENYRILFFSSTKSPSLSDNCRI